MSILGNRVRRVEDPRFLTVGGTYTADVRDPLLDGAYHVTFVRSTAAHATLAWIDVRDAQAMPGVIAVVTGAEVDLAPLGPSVPMLNAAMVRPFLAVDRVRYVGEPVAAVITETAAQGADAIEAVWVDYDSLPVVVDPEDAAEDRVLLHPAAGTNLAVEFDFGRDDTLFDGCEVVVVERLINQRVAGVPLEGRSAAAAWDDGGRLHLYVSTQNAHGVRDALAASYGLEGDRVRVVAPDVGGGFGPKIGAHPEELLLPWLSRRVGGPVRWTETRSENLVGQGHGRAQVQLVEIGGRYDGTVEAYRLSVLQDSGAYPAIGAFLPWFTRMMAAGTYVIGRIECNTSSVVTNTTPVVAYRGAGRPEATAAIERAMDLFAAEIGMDAAEVRRKNLIPAFAEPLATGVATTYDCGDYPAALEAVLEAAGYGALRAEQAARRAAGDVVALGIGVSSYVEITAGPSPGDEYAKVTVAADGSATVLTGSSPHGQGHHTGFAMIASDTLGIPIDRITVIHGDTDIVPRGTGTFGSRSLQLGGVAVLEAATSVVDQARTIAADLLEASVDDIVLDPISGAFHVAGVPSVTRSWAEVASLAGGTLAADGDFGASQPTFPFGAHVAVVEVDTETGEARLRRLIACDDAGRILNPLLAEGQRHGGIAQGIAQALYEEIRYDADGNPQTTNLADYGMVSAAELPSFELVDLSTPTWVNPLGAKGIGESGTIGSTPAVQSAVIDALAHLGVRHLDLPCTPERVWQAIEAARAGGPFVSHPIEAEGLTRRFGDIVAVDGVDLHVSEGEIFGFLGPNGAGKSTTVRMLTTLLKPTGGRARVAGHDVATEAAAVRRAIGVALQDAAIDPLMTGAELMRLQAVLHGIGRVEAERRSGELLERVGLTGAQDRRVATYSGGMRRRLDLAMSLIHQPRVLFLDEPTTGLDPTSRLSLWEEVRRLNREGTTVFLTTQYLEEADELAARVAIIDKGRLVRQGSPRELKAAVGAPTLKIELEAGGSVAKARKARKVLATFGEERIAADGTFAVGLDGGSSQMAAVVRALDDAGLKVRHLELDAPTLDDVFAEATGYRLEGGS